MCPLGDPPRTRRKLRWAHGGAACVEATEMDQFVFLCRTGQKNLRLVDWYVIGPY